MGMNSVWHGDWNHLAYHYKRHDSPTKYPQGFKEYWAREGVASPNSCAARLGYSIACVDSKFFATARHRSWIPKGNYWRLPIFGRLPQLAKDVAIILNEKLGSADLVKRKAVIQDQFGIIFFDTIPGYNGSGHISLWDQSKVVDNGDYFSSSPRVYFWKLFKLEEVGITASTVSP